MRLQDLVRRGCETFARKLPTWIINGDYLARHYVFQKDWIPDGLRPYLPRWVPSVFFHEFLRGDDDREVHNHPWKYALSIILAGGYVEERAKKRGDGTYVVETKTYRPGMLNIIRDTDFHRVALLDGKTTWTLFIAGERTGDLWGFLDTTTGVFLTWKEHLRRRESRNLNGYSRSVS